MIVLPFDGPMIILIDLNNLARQCTEVCFASFLSGGFITVIVANPTDRKKAKRTSVQCPKSTGFDNSCKKEKKNENNRFQFLDPSKLYSQANILNTN